MSSVLWVTLAGVRFTVQKRRYGKSTSVLLRTTAGKAYRLTKAHASKEWPDLKYIHDVDLEGVQFQVFTAPEESKTAEQLQGEPVAAGIGAPVLLVAGPIRFAVRRVDSLDAQPTPHPDDPPEPLPPELLAKVAEIAKEQNVSPQVAINKLLLAGYRSLMAREKHEAARAPRRRRSRH